MEVGALKTKITMDSAEFVQSMGSVQRQLKSLQQEQKAVTSSGTGFARGVDELRNKSDVLSRTLQLQQKQVLNLKQRYDEAKASTGENSKQTENAQIAYNKAVAEMKRTEEALRGVSEELDRQTNPWNVLADNMEQTGQKLQTVGKNITDFGKSWSMRVTAPIAGAGALMLKTGMDFEEGMSQVQAVSGATGADLEKLEAKARELGGTTSKSATEAASGLSYMALAGWDTQQMLDGLEPILRLSEAGAMDLGRASDLATDSMAALQIEVKDLPRYLDNVAEASRSSNTSIDQLMQAYVTAGGNLAQFNVPLDESTALLGLLANRGLKGSEAGRALNAIMVNLTSGAGQAGVAMEELGLSAFDADGNFIGLEETLQLVKDRTKDMTDEQKAQYISMIAGKEHLKSFQGLLAGLDEEYVDLKASVSEADGALNDMATTMQDNAKGNVTQLKSAFEELSIQFAQHMIPTFTAGVEKATELVQWFSELEDDTKKNIVTMGALAAAVGPVAIVFGNLTTGIGGLLTAGSSAIKMLKGPGSLAAGIGALANPVTLGVAAVAALSFGIYKYIDAQNEAKKVNLDSAYSLMEQADSLEANVNRYDELRSTSKLTVDEMGRLLDIQSELKTAQDPSVVERLQAEYEKLSKNSGLTNQELDEMLGLNNSIIEQSPNVQQSFTEKGNSVLEATHAVHDYIDSLRTMAIEELQIERIKYLENETELRETNKRLNEEIRIEEEKRNELLGLAELGYDAIKARIVEINEEIAEKKLLGEATVDLIDEERYLQGILNEGFGATLELHQDKINKQKEALAENEAELAMLGEIDARLVEMNLKKVGINATGQEGLKILDQEIAKNEQTLAELEKMSREKGQGNQEYQEAIAHVQAELAELQRARDTIKDMTGQTSLQNLEQLGLNRSVDGLNFTLLDTLSRLKNNNRTIDEGTEKAKEQTAELGKDVTKPVTVDDNGTAKAITDEAKKEVRKPVTLVATALTGFNSLVNRAVAGIRIPGYEKGTETYGGHPGGLFIAGEAGWELGRQGNQWELLGPGLYSRPAGYQVFTHDESKKIMSAAYQVPAYAEGISPMGEVNRVVRQMNSMQVQDHSSSVEKETTIYVNVVNEMDGRELSRRTYKTTAEFINRDKETRDKFA
ncbi:phage tail tape measure protein [Alkalihalophilus marmarensis]|nr:phage tail tape measure protein [Alkalihalophilus marmarensis]MED1603057.1 phage tail tape measure protein [Alkalihalophilus marmarensis]